MVDKTYGAFCYATAPIDSVRRRIAAKRSLSSPWANLVPRRDGYRLLDEDVLPGLTEFAERAGQIARQRSLEQLEKKPNNPFYPLLNDVPGDFHRYPELIRFALSDPIIDAATGYFGVVPRLFYVDLWLTRPNIIDGYYDSQLAHIDKPEASTLTLFVNLSTVSEKSGPLTFIPASATRRICEKSDYVRRYFSDDGEKASETGRLSEEKIAALASELELKRLIGPVGSAAFVDTSACLHFGSRCEEGERLIFVARFITAHRGRFPARDVFGSQETCDLVRRLVLGNA